MQLLAKMNAKMDEGYKLTTFSCQFCNGVTLAKPNAGNQSSVYCPKCNKQYEPTKNDQNEDEEYQQYYNELPAKQQNILQKSVQKKSLQIQKISQSKRNPTSPQPIQILDPVEQQYEQFLNAFNSVVKTPSQIKSQQVSKKIGEKLISGWAMMESACEQCNVPLMKSKKGNLICCGCDKDYARVGFNKKEGKNNKQQRSKSNQEQKLNNSMLKEEWKEKRNQNQASINKERQVKEKIELKSNQKGQNELKQKDQSEVNKKISNLVFKSLGFLELRLDRAIQSNDLQMVERILNSTKKAKQLMQ